MSDEVITRQIEGTLAGVNFGSGGWKEYAIDIGRQYPVKLSTKMPDLQAAAEAATGQKAVWTFTERDGNPNPHKPGEFFKNRYLSKVEVGGTLDPALAQQQASQSTPSGGSQPAGMPSPDGRERSIERQVLIKAALAYLPGPFESEDALFAFLDRLDDWMGRTRGDGQEQTNTAETPEPQADPGQGMYDELDIPFDRTIDGLGN